MSGRRTSATTLACILVAALAACSSNIGPPPEDAAAADGLADLPPDGPPLADPGAETPPPPDVPEDAKPDKGPPPDAEPDGPGPVDADPEVIVHVGCPVLGELSCGTVLDEQRTDQEGSAQLLGWYPCQPDPAASYVASPELAFSFESEQALTVTVSETTSSVADLIVLSEEGFGCAVSDSSCVTGGVSEVTFAAAAGERYYLVVDSAQSATALFGLAVSCCEPECGDDVCGEDGCGGSCGSCGQEEMCEAGACVPKPVIQCEPIESLTCGTVLTGVPLDGPSSTDVVTATSCAPELDLSGPEVAYSITTETATVLKLIVTPDDSEQLLALALLDGAVGACEPEACLVQGEHSASLATVAGGTAYVLVDGVAGATGTFGLKVECCTPSCEGKTCGPNGCGGACGQCGGSEVCLEGTCQPLPAPICQPISTLACDDALTGLVPGGPDSTDVIFSVPCNSADYGGPEMAWTFVPNEDLQLTVEVTPTQSDDVPHVLLLADEAGTCNGDSCLAWGAGAASVEVTQGAPVHVVVDGEAGAAGEFDLTVTCCAPLCDGKVCGSDGCGGVCGLCGEGHVCQQGACVPTPDPVCSPMGQLNCGTVLDELSLSDADTTDNLFQYGCTSTFDYSGPEMAWLFETDMAVELTADVTVTGSDADLDVFILDGGQDKCLGEACLSWGTTAATDVVPAGESRYVVVDGYAGAEAEFSLVVTCCELTCELPGCGMADGCGDVCGCPAGQVCAESVCCTPKCDGTTCGGDDSCGGSCGCAPGEMCIDGSCATLPSTCQPVVSVFCGVTLDGQSNGTADATFAFSDYACQTIPGDYGPTPEITHELAALADQKVTVESPDAGALVLTVLKDKGLGCSEAALCVGQGQGGLSFDAHAGHTYYLVWDSPDGLVVDDFSVNVSCCTPVCSPGSCGSDGCGGNCSCGPDLICQDQLCVAPDPGDTCETALPITALPFFFSGDTGGLYSDTYDTAAGCGPSFPLGVGQPDVAFWFTPDATGSYSVTLPGFVAGQGPSLVYITTDCADLAGSCVAYADFFAGASELSVDLEAGTTYFIIVDSANGQEIGPFSFALDGPG